MQTYLVQHQNQLDQLVAQIKDLILEQKVVLLYGEMGAGKTTFIKELCKSIGIKDEVSSPTYALVNEYHGEGLKIFHFDLFRLKSMDELLDIGFEDYLNQQALCIIEWPQLAENLLDGGLKIEIEKIDLNQRKFSIFKF